MSGKRAHIDIDPDYEDVTDEQNKRQRVLESDAKHAAVKKIEGIVKTQFGIEIQNKEHEVNLIDQRLCEARLMIDRLRACIAANFYSTADQQKFLLKSNSTQPAIHPAVKCHLGKTVKDVPVPVSSTQSSLQVSSSSSSSSNTQLSSTSTPVTVIPTVSSSSSSSSSSSTFTSTTATTSSSQHDLRDSRFKTKKRIVVGNVTKYIPVEKREANDQSTHKWMVYVRGSKDSPQIDGFVKKIWFFLHPSYRPNDLVEICQPPFHLTRRGWGEFPIRVQIHFTDSRNKKVDIIHHLKLDRTYTGLQTLGSETVVDVELERECKEINVPRPIGETLLNHEHPNHSDTNNEHCSSQEQNGVIENGTCHNKDINHTIVHSPIKAKSPIKVKTPIKVESINGEKEQNHQVSMDSKPCSEKPSAKTENLPTINSIKPSANQTFYLKCKDSKGNILLVPKMVVNTNGQSASQQQMTTFRVTTPTSSTPSLTNNRTLSGQLVTKTGDQSGVRSLLAQQSNSQTSANQAKTNSASPKPSVQLMVTSKGLQILPQTTNINSTAKTNLTVKPQNSVDLNQTGKFQSLLKSNPTLKPQQLKLNANTATPNVGSSKPVSLLLNSVNQSGTKLQLTGGGLKINPNQPKVNTVPLLVHNKNQKSLLNNSVISTPSNPTINNSPKVAPSVVLANVGSKTFLLQVQADGPINKSQNMSHPKQTVKTQLDQVKTNAFVSSANILNKVQVVPNSNLKVRQQLLDTKEHVFSHSEMEPEKRTHVWKKKVKLEEESIESLKLDDHDDMLSLIKAAVKRHPIVREKVDRNTHPYCAYSHQQWLSWNIGKKRASEWQRASWVRKFLVDNLKGETMFKGKQLWSTKQIMYWCRLHAFSPHYMESSGEETTASKTTIEESGSDLVNSLTDVNHIIQQLPQQQASSDSSDDEIDIVNVDLSNIRIKKEIKEEPDETYQNLSKEEILHIPPSQQAHYIQDTCQKIGVKLKPVDLDDNVFGSACEEMIFACMKCFAEDLLRESFAKKEIPKSGGTIQVEDVQQALVSSTTADFLTNAHLGIKRTDIFPNLR